MQMILILVGGYTLAEAPLVKRGLQWLASKPKNQAQGGLLCFGVAALACVVNWGLGLVVGALLARQVLARLRTVNFAYLVAAGYMGYMVWTAGLSSSIALANTDKTSKLNIIWTQTHQLVPLSETIFRPYSFLPMLVLAGGHRPPRPPDVAAPPGVDGAGQTSTGKRCWRWTSPPPLAPPAPSPWPSASRTSGSSTCSSSSRVRSTSCGAASLSTSAP